MRVLVVDDDVKATELIAVRSWRWAAQYDVRMAAARQSGRRGRSYPT